MTKFNTNFTVMPNHANYLSPLIFGGAFYSQMDLCAVQTAHQALHDSKGEYAITHKHEVTWYKPCYVGDLIFLEGEVIEVREKSLAVSVTATRQKHGNPIKDLVGTAYFVFVTISDVKDLSNKPEYLPYVRHDLNKSSNHSQWQHYDEYIVGISGSRKEDSTS